MADKRTTTTDLRERVAKLHAADEERRKAVEALCASEEFSAHLLASSPNPVIVINPDMSIRYANPALLELTGFAAEEVIDAKIPYPWWPDEKLDEVGKSLKIAMEGGLRNVECAFEKKNGEPFWVQISFSPIESEGELKYFLCNWVDIAEHKHIEEKLARERVLLRTLIDNLPDLVYVKDVESRFITGNIAVARLMGADGPDELIGKTDFDFHPEELARVYRADEEEVMRSGQPIVGREERVVTAEGETRFFSSTKVPLRSSDGEVVGIVGMGRDITDRKRAEEDLAGERALLRTLIDNLPDCIYVKDAESRFVTCNRAVARLLGAGDPEDLVGKTEFDFQPEESAKPHRADEEEVMRSGKPIIAWEEKIVDAKGEPRWVSTTKVPLRDADGKVIGLVGMDRDITRRRELEEEIKDRNAELELRNLIDSLTGALNRRFLNHDLPILYDAFTRTGIPLAIVMLDLDGLKGINDTHGHDVGDEALRVFASTTREILRRKTDMFIRYGGDEFMLVLFSAARRSQDSTPADVIAEESCNILLQKMRETDVAKSKEDGTPIRMTFSAGVAMLEGQEPLGAIIKRADVALYAAKTGGRDRVVRYTPGMKRDQKS